MKLKPLKIKKANNLLSYFNVKLTRRQTVEILDKVYIRIDGVVSFFYYEEELIPSLRFLRSNPSLLRQVIVDMGAVKHILQGSDIMRPGVVKIDSQIHANEIVIILDEKYFTPIVVGRALFSGKDMESSSTGKIIKNIHYIGDDIWNL
jgi:PUA-domain protein